MTRHTYTTAECTAASTNYADALIALKKFALGTLPSRIRHANKEVERNAADETRLRRYADQQKQIVDSCAGCRRTPTASFRFIPN